MSSQLSDLKVHIEEWCGQVVPDFNCPQCNKPFYDKGNMDCHILVIHEGKLPCVCKECGEAFKWLSQLSIHKKTKHCKT